MGLNNDKGREYELHVAKIVRRKVGKGTMRNRGSHANWHRRSDIYTELPIHLEAKHHENVRIKEWMEQAEAAKSFSQTAVVAFRIEEEDYACLKLTDLLDLFVQVADQQLEIEDLRAPIPVPTAPAQPEDSVLADVEKPRKSAKVEAETLARQATERKAANEELKMCRNGHIVAVGNKCMWKGCQYSTTAKKAKAKKEGK